MPNILLTVQCMGLFWAEELRRIYPEATPEQLASVAICGEDCARLTGLFLEADDPRVTLPESVK